MFTSELNVYVWQNLNAEVAQMLDRSNTVCDKKSRPQSLCRGMKYTWSNGDWTVADSVESLTSGSLVHRNNLLDPWSSAQGTRCAL